MNKILLALLVYVNLGIIRMLSIASIVNNRTINLFVKKVYAKNMISGCKNHGYLYAIV